MAASSALVSASEGNVNFLLYLAGAAQTAAGDINARTTKQSYHRRQRGCDGKWSATYPSFNYNYIFGSGTPDVRRLNGLTGLPAAGSPRAISIP